MGVRFAAYSPDGKLLASGGDDKTIRIWDTDSKKELKCLRQHKDWIYVICFSPDGRELVSSGRESKIIVWNTKSWEVIRELKGHSNWLCSITFHPK